MRNRTEFSIALSSAFHIYELLSFRVIHKLVHTLTSSFGLVHVMGDLEADFSLSPTEYWKFAESRFQVPLLHTTHK